MSVKIVSTQNRYELSDDGGYVFEVISNYDPEWGWSAAVTIGATRSHGFKCSESALRSLCKEIAHLHEILKQEFPDEFR